MTKAQKEAQQRWRDKNRDKYNEYQLVLSNRYYEENKEKVLEYKKKKYVYEKQCQLFRNILIQE
jgi:hypothetical protein